MGAANAAKHGSLCTVGSRGRLSRFECVASAVRLIVGNASVLADIMDFNL